MEAKCKGLMLGFSVGGEFVKNDNRAGRPKRRGAVLVVRGAKLIESGGIMVMVMVVVESDFDLSGIPAVKDYGKGT